MDFKDSVRQLAERVARMKEQIATEEATKTAVIMPFLQVLGYDVFNPMEVVPEFIADVGIKKGEKVDYALIRDGNPIILIEAKHWKQKLDNHDSQLVRYFNISKSRFAILTNGFTYRFFTDLVEPNEMDEKPFLEFELLKVSDAQIEELKKFHKSYFDLNSILGSANELKYTGELRAILQSELRNPSEAFVRFLTQQVFTGRLTDKVVFQFSDFVRKSVSQVVSDLITDRLQLALDQEKQAAQSQQEGAAGDATADEAKEKQVETTGEELEAFYIVKSILRQQLDSTRITFRDTQSYFNVLLDDNIRKTICRLYLNGNKKFVGCFDAAKKEVKTEIMVLDDIYKCADVIRATVETYLGLKP